MKRADILRQLKKGDVVVNPWVSKEFNGKYNPKDALRAYARPSNE